MENDADMTEHANRPAKAATHPPELDAYLTPTDTRSYIVKQGQVYLRDVRQWMIDNHLGLSPLRAMRRYAKAHDALIEAAYLHAAAQWRKEHGSASLPPVALVALGGYGRRELFLKSDIDLLFLMSDNNNECDQFIKPMLYMLIDMRLDLGYATRSITDCKNMIGLDLESVTALIEGVQICGNRKLFQDFRLALHDAMWNKARRWFLKGHFEQWRERHKKYESTIYLLEPNLKEGQGGLRDVHCVRWALYAVCGSTELRGLIEYAGFSENELKRYREAIGVLLRIRNEIHIASETKSDQLLYRIQQRIAERFEYKEQDGRLPEERFMQDYYHQAKIVERQSHRALYAILARDRRLLRDLIGRISRRRLDENLAVQNGSMFIVDGREKWLEKDPQAVMNLFLKAARGGWNISERTLDLLSRHSQTLGEEFSENSENNKRLMTILKGPANVARTLETMHACGVLGKLVPEFARIESMVRIDHYHHYTVDEHTLKTIAMAEELLGDPPREVAFTSTIAHQIKRWDLLNLSLLLHDVGKGYGRGHALRGGALAQRVCERMELPAADMECVRHLVLSHLKLNHAAQRRDPSDPIVARQLADECGKLERLRMLLVVTVSDLRGVSPSAFNDWKAQLLRESYLNAEAVFEGTSETRARRKPNLAHLEKHIIETIAGDPELDGVYKRAEAGVEEIKSFLANAPNRYLALATPGRMAHHFLMRTSLTDERPAAWRWFHDENKDYTDLSVCAADAPGTFSHLCGALATKGINILSAQIFSTNDGYAINHFEVTDLDHRPLARDLTFDRLLDDLNLVLAEKKTFKELVRKHRGRRRHDEFIPRSPIPSQVTFDNDGSQEYTLLEVRMRDHPGVLYHIACVLRDHRINIHRAMITTVAYGVHDTFYITDLEYNKIHHAPTQEALQADLLEAVEQDS